MRIIRRALRPESNIGSGAQILDLDPAETAGSWLLSPQEDVGTHEPNTPTAGDSERHSNMLGTHHSNMLATHPQEDALRELAFKLKDTQSLDGTVSTQTGSKFAELRYAKFKIGGFSGDKHVVFVPDNLKLSLPVLEQVCCALDRDLPSMLLCGMSSLCHPGNLSTPQLRSSPGFQELMEDARNSMGIKKEHTTSSWLRVNCGSGNEINSDTEPQNKGLIDTANRVLEKRVAAAVGTIAHAAKWTNVWVFSGPQVTNFEVFLHQCQESPESDVFHMVVGHMQDKAYMETDTSRNLLRYLFDNSQVMSAEYVLKANPLPLPNDLWNPARSPHREFAEHGFERWSFESYSDERSKGHPITQWPWPHADLIMLFYREESPMDTNSACGPDWDYATKKKYDWDAIPFSPEELAPVGYVFIGGNEINAKRKLLQAVRLGSPVIILDNTPNVTKQMSIFVRILQKLWDRDPTNSLRQFLADGAAAKLGRKPSVVDLLEALLPSKIMNYIEELYDTSAMEDSERFALSDVVGLIELVKRRPQTFRDRVAIVDPLQPHSVGSGSNDLLSIMSSHRSGLREADSTVFHKSLVLKGWRLHRRLSRRAKQLRNQGTALVIGISLVMIMSTCLAVLLVCAHIEKSQARIKELAYNLTLPDGGDSFEVTFTMSDTLQSLHIMMLVFPIIAGLLHTLQGHLQLAQKWSGMHMASNQVVSEIHRFLVGVVPYKLNTSENQKRFVSRLQELVKNLSLYGVREDDLMEESVSASDMFPQNAEALDQHVKQYVYNMQPEGLCNRRFRDIMTSFGRCFGASWTELLLDAHESRDLTAPLTAEKYMEMRVLPLRKCYYDHMHKMHKVRVSLYVVLALSLSAGAAFGASGFSLWIPVALSLATFATTMMQWLVPSENVAAVQSAMTTLNNLDLRWQGSDIKEHRTEATRHRLVNTTERLAWAVESSFTGCASFPELDQEEEVNKASTPDIHSSRRGSWSPMSKHESMSRRSWSRNSSSRASPQVMTPYGRTGSMTPLI
jgi:hypothetical protein